MKYGIAAASAAALVLSGGAALAQDEDCFDKGDLSYHDCPAEPEPVMEEEVYIEEDDSGPYAGFRGGLAFIDAEYDFDAAESIDTDHDTGYVISAMIGYKFDEVMPGISLRPELELGYLAGDVSDDDSSVFGDLDGYGDTSVFFGFVNLFADIEIIDSVDLIVGGGVGFGSVDLDGHGDVVGDTIDDSAFGFGYNIGAGLGFEVAEGITMEAMYRYMSFDADLTSLDPYDTDADVDAHTATIGLRFDF